MPNGTKRRRIHSTGTSEHAIAKQIAVTYESKAAVRSHGVIDAEEEAFTLAKKIKIEAVLPAFEAKMRQKGKSSSRNALDQLRFVRAFCDHAAISTIGELRADLVNLFKVHLLELGLSSRTVQANLGALKHFTSWLLKTGKLRYDPLLSVEKPDPKSDRRHERRMLLPSEWEWLVRGAMSAGAHHELNAESRVLLYRVTIQTGLRQNELRSLNRGHFHLDGDEPFVKVFSGNTKNSQAAYQSIDKGLAADLR